MVTSVINPAVAKSLERYGTRCYLERSVYVGYLVVGDRRLALAVENIYLKNVIYHANVLDLGTLRDNYILRVGYTVSGNYIILILMIISVINPAVAKALERNLAVSDLKRSVYVGYLVVRDRRLSVDILNIYFKDIFGRTNVLDVGTLRNNYILLVGKTVAINLIHVVAMRISVIYPTVAKRLKRYGTRSDLKRSVYVGYLIVGDRRLAVDIPNIYFKDIFGRANVLDLGVLCDNHSLLVSKAVTGNHIALLVVVISIINPPAIKALKRHKTMSDLKKTDNQRYVIVVGNVLLTHIIIDREIDRILDATYIFDLTHPADHKAVIAAKAIADQRGIAPRRTAVNSALGGCGYRYGTLCYTQRSVRMTYLIIVADINLVSINYLSLKDVGVLSDVDSCRPIEGHYTVCLQNIGVNRCRNSGRLLDITVINKACRVRAKRHRTLCHGETSLFDRIIVEFRHILAVGTYEAYLEGVGYLSDVHDRGHRHELNSVALSNRAVNYSEISAL